MKTLKKYAIRSKSNGALLRIECFSVFEKKSHREIEFGVDEPILNTDIYIQNLYKINSKKSNLIIWYTNRKEIAEKVLNNMIYYTNYIYFDKLKNNSMEIPYIEVLKNENSDLFEIVEIELKIK